MAQNAIVTLRNRVGQECQERRLKSLVNLFCNPRIDKTSVLEEYFTRGNYHRTVGHFEAARLGAIQKVHDLENLLLQCGQGHSTRGQYRHVLALVGNDSFDAGPATRACSWRRG